MDGRKTIDCRKFPNPEGCTLTISGKKDEVLKAAVNHGVAVHGFQDSPQVRSEIDTAIEDEQPMKPSLGRKVSDCRSMAGDTSSEQECTLTFSGREDEVVDAAVEHAVSAHGCTYSSDLERSIRNSLVDEYAFEQEQPQPSA